MSASSNASGYKSVRFGDSHDNENEGPPRLRSVILKTVQNIYRELAKTERPPLDLDNWYHSAILSYRIDPVSITLRIVEGENSPIFIMPEPRFELVTDGGENPRGVLADLITDKRKTLPAKINADFQVVRDWVAADIKRRGLDKPDAVAARAAAKAKKAKAAAEDWQQKFKSCTGCRIICCVKPGCVSEIDGATGCMRHPRTVYCLACRDKLASKILPEIMECPDCQGTYCRADFSWCIGLLSSPDDSTPGCRGGRPCCNPQCWSTETGGALDGLNPRAICTDCAEEFEGEKCAGNHLWLCPQCFSDNPPTNTIRKCEECGTYSCTDCDAGEIEGTRTCAECKAVFDEIDPEDPGCVKCGVWVCDSCESAEEEY
ncbi:hypothetical protein C8R44DRAFT_748116 [Mycena epipterygia]|nr:hypothetical protein C8R44DRAFT_748116 [Mycena epipterygia]